MKNTKKRGISYREDVLKYAAVQYGTQAEYPWASSADSAVLRHKDNKKWYGIIMNVKRETLGIGSGGEIDILNVKFDSLLAGPILDEKGILPAYHMNKSTWISVLLDGSVDLDKITFLLDLSFMLTQDKKQRSAGREWIVPANPKYYDVKKAFEQDEIILWKQSSNIAVGDTVYVYVAAPDSSILYKCEAVETDIPCNFDNGQVRMKKMMRIKREHIFNKGQLGLEVLKKHGVCWVRGPRRVPFSLSREIEDICGKKEP